MVDFNLNQGKPIVNRDIDCLKQQISILFDTKKHDLHGDISYGTDYENCLFDLQYSSEEMTQKMRDDLSMLDLLGFTPSVTSYLLDGTERDIMLIHVDLKRNYENYSTTYKIE